ADQIVSSASTNVIESSKITKSPVHIDPNFVNKESMHNDICTASDLSMSKNNKYSEMQIQKDINGGFLVENPPFGSNFRIVPTKERKLDELNNDLKLMVEIKNKKLKNYTLK